MAHDKKPADNDNIHPISKHFLWLGDDKIVKGFILVPIIGLVITVMAQFIYPFDEHHMAPWDKIHASWAIIGFCAYSFVVLSAEPLFKLLSRSEDYYGEGQDDD